MNFFKQYQSISTSLALLRGYREHEDYDLTDHLPVDINLNSVLDLRDNSQRLQDVAVMIIDYNMPQKNGIELCYELRGLPIKKILLTGEASHQKAVDAFNDGVIDCFFRKDNLALSADLTTQITRLQKQYFTDVTKHLLSHLEVDYKLPQSDPVFIEFFDEWCKGNQICEYYVVDKNGTFLTINANGAIKYFITHTDRSLNNFTEIYTDVDEVNLHIQSVTQRNKIPFFGIKKESWNCEFDQWVDHLHDPSILDGRERYYWSILES